MAALVQTQGLTRRYDDLTALDSLNLEVEQGSIFGFIGPNGAGKTTTIRILCTLLEPTSGEAWIEGYSVLDEPDAVRRRIGYMPDFFGVYEDMKVWEYLDFFAACYEVPANRRGKMTDDLLGLVDLGEKKLAYVESLSRGMKQRLCLARTLVHDPSLLILDEPASGMDPRARVEMRELLKELRSMGKTIVLSSHILSELADVCTHIGIIERGRLLDTGRVEDMISRLAVRKLIRLRVGARALTARQMLADTPGVIEPKFDGEVPQTDEEPAALSFGLTDDAEDQSQVIDRLVSVGVPVRSFTEEAGDLEDVFLQVTKGEVQ